MEFIFIDASYFIFYRVFALTTWWKNAKPDEPLENPFQNQTFVEKFKSTFADKIKEIIKKSKMKDPVVFVGKDCFQKNIWRMNIFPEYKKGRDETKNEQANVGNFFKMVYEEQLFEQAKIENILFINGLEADDCIALSVKKLLKENKDHKILIITSDHDYLQLLHPNVTIMDLKFKELVSSKKAYNTPEKNLFCKIVLGDKSDNINGLFKKCGPKTIEKLYENQEEFQEKLVKENAVNQYELNKTLIDFNCIPYELQSLFYQTFNSKFEY